jgi:hypothetical protein
MGSFPFFETGHLELIIMADRILGVNVPADPATIIWRYMNLDKFQSLCEHRSLWFSRVDGFNDRWEGVVPEQARMTHPHLTQWIHERRSKSYVNCWHVNEYESALMWRNYTEGDGVAIQSTFERLDNVLATRNPVVYLGLVNYISYDSEMFAGWENNANIFHPIFHKRRYFNGEQELRALINPMSNESIAAANRDLMGLLVPVSLSELVVSIRVHTSSTDQFQRVNDIAASSSLCVPINLSSVLDSPP